MTVLKSVLVFFLFMVLYVIKQFLPMNNVDTTMLFLLGVLLVSVIYIIFYIISEDHWQEILGGIIISVLLSAGTAIFPLIGILLAIWIIYSIIMALKSVVQLIPVSLVSILVYSSLLSDFTLSLFSVNYIPLLNTTEFTIKSLVSLVQQNFLTRGVSTIIDIVYLVIGLVFSIYTVIKYELKSALFQAAIMFASVPLVALIIYSIKTSIDNLFHKNTTYVTQKEKVAQNVHGYTRANGTFVDGFTRSVSKDVTHAVTNTTIGIGASTLNATATVSKKLKNSKKLEIEES